MSHFVSECWQLFVEMPVPILVSILIWVVIYLLNAVSFGLMLPAGRKPVDSDGVPSISLLRVTIAGYALNYITPFGLLGGEPYRIWYLKRYMPVSESAWSVGLYAAMHVTSHFVFWLIAIIAGIEVLSDTISVWSFTLAVVVVCNATLWFSHYRKIGVSVTFLSLSVDLLSRIVGVFEYWLFMHTVGLGNATFCDAFLVVAISSLFANILFFSPLQAGTREAGITLALALLYGGGVEAAANPDYIALGVTISLATRVREFFWIAVGCALVGGNPLRWIRRNPKPLTE